eukprot:CAMPEP_0172402750 /NCGR_PEP_ID=MMETSP1061-20121228/55955_2 /TAXON_ID=37318 /ORGANISM="Pseudo-nitzschia pungens, Strain cf. pungens" /LENGTH=52 /DNA_ID=CAMNT_0013136865 /DNA_START=364 /DNA_END=522 /DNA_ORIENTATION=-
MVHSGNDGTSLHVGHDARLDGFRRTGGRSEQYGAGIVLGIVCHRNGSIADSK